MSKANISGVRESRNDWHDLIKSVGLEPVFAGESGACGALAVGVRKGCTVISGRASIRAIALAGGLVLAGLVLLTCGCVFLFGGIGGVLLGVAGIAIGVGFMGVGMFALLKRPGICMSADGAELVIACGLRRRFRLDARELIPRLSAAGGSDKFDQKQSDSEVYLKLYNITLRQAVVLVRGDRDYASDVLGALSEMLGTDKLDSTFMEVKLAGLADDWVDVEARRPEEEPQPDDSPPDSSTSERTFRPMRAGGLIFMGAQLVFPEKGQAVIQLPALRRIAPPVAISVVIWIVFTLLLSVVGGAVGMSATAAMVIGELLLTAMVIGVAAFFWYYGGPITIDRLKRTISGPRRPKCGFTGQEISTNNVTMIQSCLDAPPGADPETDTLRYEVNLVMKNVPRRIHLLTDTDEQRVRQSAEELAEFLNVSHWDCCNQSE